MKKNYFLIFILFFNLINGGLKINSQTTNDVLELLIRNGTIKVEQADSVRADAAIKQLEADAKKKSFNISSGKALQVSAYTQVRYQMLEEKGKNDGFDIRRAYLDLKGSLSPYFSYRLQTDIANSPKIVDAQVDVKLFDYLNLTIGQQSIPFSLNNVTSNTKLDLADRSQVVESLSSRKGDLIMGDNNGRDIGLSAYGSILPINKLNLIEYRIGVFNGSGINRADFNDVKDVIGRIILHPIKGLDLGASFYSGWTPDSAALAGELTKLNLKLDNSYKPSFSGLRQRFGGELSYSYKFISLKAEFLTGKDGGIIRSGYYGQIAAFVLPGRLQLACRYDTYDKDVNKDDNISTYIVFGANYFFSPNALLQVAYTIKQEEITSFVNNSGAIQLQISF
jgi:phosphate-selective porin OprO/OprP